MVTLPLPFVDTHFSKSCVKVTEEALRVHLMTHRLCREKAVICCKIYAKLTHTACLSAVY
jgi:hypothetical protein